MRRSGSGLANLVKSVPLPSGGIGLRRLINGTLMKWSFLSAGANSGFGARSTAIAPLIAASSDCRATDVLDILVQSRRNTKAAKRLMRKLVKHYGEPRVLITDKLGSYGSAKRNLIAGVEHRRHKGLNNIAEVSHRQTRRREKIFGRFKSPRQAQMFLAAHDQISCLFRPRRHILSAISYRHARSDAHSLWSEYSAELIA